jgi:hypothetical protein
MAQTETAFRRATTGDTWSRAFLRARAGDRLPSSYQPNPPVSIPVRLDYAVSPSTGAAETPGTIGGWATGPAKEFAARLYVSLETGAPAPIPTDPDSFWSTYAGQAQASGKDVLQSVLAEAARRGYSALPEGAKKALAGLGIQYYGGQLGGTVTAAVPWLLGAIVVFGLVQARRRG